MSANWRKIMAATKPTAIDRAKVKLWSKKKASDELRKHAVNGDREWVMFLLDETDYETINTFLDPGAWQRKSLEELRNVTSVVGHVLKNAPPERLPPQADPARIVASFKQEILRRSPKVRLKKK
jgi:hypothetical protein